MKILFVAAHYNPFDGQKAGAGQRTSLLLDACCAIGEVDVVVFSDGAKADRTNCRVVLAEDYSLVPHETRWDKFKRMLEPWNLSAYYPRQAAIADKIDALINKGEYDLIVTRYLPVAAACGLLAYRDRLVVDVDDNPVDVEKLLSKQSNTFRSKLYHRLVSWTLNWAVSNTLDWVKFSYFPNSLQVHRGNSAYLPNIPFYNQDVCPGATDNHQLLFVGDLRYEPNWRGIEHFVDEILPLIRQQVGDVKLAIVGKVQSKEWKNKVESKGVCVKGFVEDLTCEYSNAQVCVVPVYVGAGTNIKVLEALQMGRACVTTKAATRGFDATLENGKDYVVANNDQEFADKVVALLTDMSYNHQIAMQGSASVRKYYSRDEFMDIIRRSIG